MMGGIGGIGVIGNNNGNNNHAGMMGETTTIRLGQQNNRVGFQQTTGMPPSGQTTVLAQAQSQMERQQHYQNQQTGNNTTNIGTPLLD